MRIGRNRVRQIVADDAFEGLSSRHAAGSVKVAEQIIERTVLQHEHDDVLECVQAFAGDLGVSRDRHGRSADRRRRARTFDDIPA